MCAARRSLDRKLSQKKGMPGRPKHLLPSTFLRLELHSMNTGIGATLVHLGLARRTKVQLCSYSRTVCCSTNDRYNLLIHRRPDDIVGWRRVPPAALSRAASSRRCFSSPAGGGDRGVEGGDRLWRRKRAKDGREQTTEGREQHSRPATDLRVASAACRKRLPTEHATQLRALALAVCLLCKPPSPVLRSRQVRLDGCTSNGCEDVCNRKLPVLKVSHHGPPDRLSRVVARP